jgi:predicted enzyme related to lactoylglutathione lyase
MEFIGLSLITENVTLLVDFYEKVFLVHADGDSIHSTLSIKGLSLSIYSKQASISDMKFSYLDNANAGYTTLMFLVENVDHEYEKLKTLKVDIITIPTEYPWGTKAFHFRDPDGNIIDFVQRIAK